MAYRGRDFTAVCDMMENCHICGRVLVGGERRVYVAVKFGYRPWCSVCYGQTDAAKLPQL